MEKTATEEGKQKELDGKLSQNEQIRETGPGSARWKFPEA